MRITAWETRMNWFVTFFWRHIYMDVPGLTNPQELINISSCRDTGCRLENIPGVMDDWDRRRENHGKTLLAAWLDNDDDDSMCVFVCTSVCDGWVHWVLLRVVPYYLPIAKGRIVWFIPFSRVSVVCKMQTPSSRMYIHLQWRSASN